MKTFLIPCLIFASFACLAQTPAEKIIVDPAAHSVIVPYDGKKPPQGQSANRFYLDYTEFQRLWNLAKENRRPAKAEPENVKPDATVVSALYDTQIFDDHLHIDARFNVIVRGGPWVKLALPFKGGDIAMGEVKLDGLTTAFKDGEILIEKSGTHLVEIALDSRVGRGWKNIAVQTPPAAAAILAVKVPAADGRPGFWKEFDELVVEENRNGTRVFTAPLGSTHQIYLARTIARRHEATAAPASVVNDLQIQILPQLERVHANVRFAFAGAERDRFTVVLDESLQPVSWNVPHLKSWQLRKENGKLSADITLNRSVADEFSLSLDAERVFDARDGKRSAAAIVGDARSTVTNYQFQIADGLQFKAETVAGVERAALNPVGNTDLAVTAAAAFRVTGAAKPSYVIASAEDRSTATFDAVYQLSAQKAEIIAAITLDSGRTALTDARVGIPAGFEVQTVAGPRVVSWHREGDEVLVRFDAQPQRGAQLVLHIAKTVAAATNEWKLEPLKLPQFKKHEGRALIAVHAADDVKLIFDGADRMLAELDPASFDAPISVAPPFLVKRALKIGKTEWSASVTMTKQAPRFGADAILLARANDFGLQLSQQIAIAVEQGAVASVKVRLPASLPLARVYGAMVRDVQSAVIGAVREYSITFQTEALERADFAMDIDLPLDGEKTLPLAQVVGAARTRRFAVVDNAGAREMKLEAGGAESIARDTVPYLPDGLVRPKFFVTGDGAALKLSFKQLESTAGNAAIITLAEITTGLRENGERWETVVYSIANRALQFLPVKLPDGAELIEVSVGGQNVRADRSSDNSHFLVPLIQMRAGELSQQVKLVYRLATEKSIVATHKMQQPQLIDLSAERTLWNVWVPERFVAKTFDGNMEEIGQQGRELDKMQSELSDISRLNRELASGNLSKGEAQVAWGNVNRKLSEVKQVQELRKRRLYSSIDEAEFDHVKGDKLGRVVQQKEAEVLKQIDSQGALAFSNGALVAQPPVNKPTGGSGPAPQQGLQLQGDILPNHGTVVSQIWNYNKDAQQQGTQTFKKSGDGTIALQGGNLDLNDNVTVTNEFFSGTVQKSEVLGTGGVTLGNAAGAKGVQKPQEPSAPNSVGNLASNALSNNARAGQSVQAASANGETIDLNGAAGGVNVGGVAGGGGRGGAGAGTLVLNGASNTYSGGITVSGGTFTLGSGSATIADREISRRMVATQEAKRATQPAQDAAEQALQRGVSQRNVGDLDNATKSFQEALRLDRSNEAARRGLEEVERSKAQYYRTARDQTRAGMLSNLGLAGEQKVPVGAAASVSGKPQTEGLRAGGNAIVPDSIDGLLHAANRPSAAPSALPAIVEGNKKVQDGDDKDAAKRFANRGELSTREPIAMTPQLKPVGRVSLTVDVPLEGRVYNFSKLKDHAVLEVTVTKAFDARQRGALWFLVSGTAFLIICAFIQRLWQRRNKAVPHVAAAAV